MMDAVILSALSPHILFISYILGSIPFGLLLTRLAGYGNIREIGSGNIGTTNVLRTGNKKLALATLILDGSKGAIAILAITNFPQFISESVHNDSFVMSANAMFTITCVIGLFAILGHCFPIWLTFKGGKGVATSLGVLLIAVPYAGLAACATWLAMALIFRISSLAALIAALIAPIVTFFVYGSAPAGICTLITILVWIRHKDNIKRLLKGTEPKIGSKKKEQDARPVSE